MKITKLIAIFLAVSAIAAQVVWAATAEELESTIIKYGLDAKAVDSKTVTVAGAKSNATTTLTLNINSDVTVLWKAELTGNVLNELIIKSGKGIFKMEGGSIKGTSNNSLYNAIRIDGGYVIISGGEISASPGYGIKNYSDGTVTITGGTIKMDGLGSVAIYNVSNGTVNIKGGIIKGDYAIYNVYNGTVNISGGEISASGSKVVFGLSPGGTININGGEIFSDRKSGIPAAVSAGKVIVSTPAKITSITSK
ncbi:hypothetical protein R83H12_01155 [Fibrobacteria bacterium R8-3-H12]